MGGERDKGGNGTVDTSGTAGSLGDPASISKSKPNSNSNRDSNTADQNTPTAWTPTLPSHLLAESPVPQSQTNLMDYVNYGGHLDFDSDGELTELTSDSE